MKRAILISLAVVVTSLFCMGGCQNACSGDSAYTPPSSQPDPVVTPVPGAVALVGIGLLLVRHMRLRK